MLHGIGSNEEDLLGLAPYLDGRLLDRERARAHSDGAGGVRLVQHRVHAARHAGRRRAGEERVCASWRIRPRRTIEAYGAERGRVYLMGFSQGAMMGLALALAGPKEWRARS